MRISIFSFIGNTWKEKLDAAHVGPFYRIKTIYHRQEPNGMTQENTFSFHKTNLPQNALRKNQKDSSIRCLGKTIIQNNSIQYTDNTDRALMSFPSVNQPSSGIVKKRNG